MAGQAFGIFPILATLRADAAGVECIPETSASRAANPSVGWRRGPFAFRAEYFDFSHQAKMCFTPNL